MKSRLDVISNRKNSKRFSAASKRSIVMDAFDNLDNIMLYCEQMLSWLRGDVKIKVLGGITMVQLPLFWRGGGLKWK